MKNKMSDYPKGCIRTYSGVSFNVLNPKPEDVRLDDIAHALSMQCRWGGHSNQFYSVAQHCVDGALYMQERAGYEYAACLEFLMHDSAEAYLVDLPSPIKRKMPKYAITEAKVMEAIRLALNIPNDFSIAVEMGDGSMLNYEWEKLMIGPRPGSTIGPIDRRPFGWLPKVAKAKFLAHYFFLKHMVEQEAAVTL